MGCSRVITAEDLEAEIAISVGHQVRESRRVLLGRERASQPLGLKVKDREAKRRVADDVHVRPCERGHGSVGRHDLARRREGHFLCIVHKRPVPSQPGVIAAAARSRARKGGGEKQACRGEHLRLGGGAGRSKANPQRAVKIHSSKSTAAFGTQPGRSSARCLRDWGLLCFLSIQAGAFGFWSCTAAGGERAPAPLRLRNCQ